MRDGAGWLAEYDKDMGAKEKTLQEELALHADVTRQLKEYEMHYKALREEAERDAEMKKKRETKERAKKIVFTQQEAASYIQKMWKKHTEEKAAEAAKPAKKTPAKKGKK